MGCADRSSLFAAQSPILPPSQSAPRGALRHAAALCSLLALLFSWPASAQSLSDLANSAKGATRDVFGSTSFASRSLKALPQWRRVLNKVRDQGAAYGKCARSAAACNSEALKAWRRILTEASGSERSEQLKQVNLYFNRWPYKQDRAVYGRSEYWATPVEFMTHSGDCEDYAIAKFFALRHVGFANDELRIVVVWDSIRGLGHAVLAIYGRDGIRILDSLTNFILGDGRYSHYIPQVSVNETTRWAHVTAGKQIPSWATQN